MELYEKNGNILYILNILKKYSSESHLLLSNKISKLVEEEYNVKIDSRTVRRNINLLIEKFNYDIEKYEENNKGYYIRKDPDVEFENNPDSSEKDFNVFYSYHGFGIEKKDNYKYVYMWVFSQSYYLEEENSLAIAGGSSIPLKFTFKNNKIIKCEYPKDGSEYISSIKRMFPGIIANQVLNFDNDKNINKLVNEVNNKKNIYYDYLTLDMSKITLDDISYNDLIFTITTSNKNCIPIQLSVYKNNKYILYTEYEACKSNQICNMMLKYTKSIEKKYDYDTIQIIKHSMDANNMQFTNDNLPQYEITAGNGYQFITDDDNKYLADFLKSININLNKCAKPDYIDK